MSMELDFGSVNPQLIAATADLMNTMPTVETAVKKPSKLGMKVAGVGLTAALTAGGVVYNNNESGSIASADYNTTISTSLEEATAGPAREVSKPAEVRNRELFITADHAEYIELERDAAGKLYMPIGVIGEKPCGPQVDKEEAMRRMAAGEEIVKPDETADFLNNNPLVEKGLNDKYIEKSNGDTEWIDFLIDELNPTNTDVLDGGKDAGVRGLKARTEAAVLTEDINVQNFACDIETGKIFENDGPNGAYNHLQKGEQVWVINIPQDILDKMAKEDIKLPDSLVTVLKNDKEGAEIILERLSCNNPLFDLEQPPVVKPPVTVETTVPVDSTISTTPDTTTSTTSTTSTTTPPTSSSTTSTTSTSTTSTSTTSTTVPHTTTTTTIPETTSTRPEVTVPTQSSVISGPGAGGTPDTDNNPDNNVTTSQVTTTTEKKNPATTTTTTQAPKPAPSSVTSTTLGHVVVD